MILAEERNCRFSWGYIFLGKGSKCTKKTKPKASQSYQKTKPPRNKMTPDICDEVCDAVYAICMDPQAQDIQSAVMEIPGLMEVDCVYELVVLAIQKAIESEDWTEPQLTALEDARTHFENMEY